MEIPRIWRETETRVKFEGSFKKEGENVYFKYPGGEVLARNAEDLMERLMQKGFRDEEVIEIVELFLLTVTTETAISINEVGDSLFQLVGSKVGE